MAAKKSRFRGRTARITRSSRQDSNWDSEPEVIYSTSQGAMTRRQYLAARQRSDVKSQFSMYLGEAKDTVYSRRDCTCGGRILYLPDGKAVCQNPHCSTVFNDGGNTEDEEGNSLVRVTRIFGDGHQEAAPPPEKHKWLPKSFMRAAKTAQPG